MIETVGNSYYPYNKNHTRAIIVIDRLPLERNDVSSVVALIRNGSCRNRSGHCVRHRRMASTGEGSAESTDLHPGWMPFRAGFERTGRGKVRGVHRNPVRKATIE